MAAADRAIVKQLVSQKHKSILNLTSIIMIMSAKFDQHIETRIQNEVFKTDIPAVVMGKISKDGDMSFYSNGPARWDRDHSITPQTFLVLLP